MMAQFRLRHGMNAAEYYTCGRNVDYQLHEIQVAHAEAR